MSGEGQNRFLRLSDDGTVATASALVLLTNGEGQNRLLRFSDDLTVATPSALVLLLISNNHFVAFDVIYGPKRCAICIDAIPSLALLNWPLRYRQLNTVENSIIMASTVADVYRRSDISSRMRLRCEKSQRN
uniref:Transposase n=1 Tax=Panagrellus redivivus TaxID=6233 RepID=A0A7E4V9P9_PANRE